MTVGTKSLLFGAHAFFVHPLFVALGWARLWWLPWDARLWICFLVHDVGYFGRDTIDGEGSEQHVVLGAKIAGWICGARYASECYRHSREWCRKNGQTVSRLCLADKLAFVLTPWWLYLPMAWLSGEIAEYLERSRDVRRCHQYTDDEFRLIMAGNLREWLRGLQMYTARWVCEHRASATDATGAVRNSRSECSIPN